MFGEEPLDSDCEEEAEGPSLANKAAVRLLQQIDDWFERNREQ